MCARSLHYIVAHRLLPGQLFAAPADVLNAFQESGADYVRSVWDRAVCEPDAIAKAAPNEGFLMYFPPHFRELEWRSDVRGLGASSDPPLIRARHHRIPKAVIVSEYRGDCIKESGNCWLGWLETVVDMSSAFGPLA